MSLDRANVLLVDAQTTGMRPPSAHLLELAWSLGTFETLKLSPVESYLVALPEGVEIPRRVSEITGLRTEDLAQATPTADLSQKFQTSVRQAEALIIHYAQFEKPFLYQLLKTEGLPCPVICTHQLVKRLFPNLPSQNIRATAGYFGPALIGHNRAGVFVKATEQIWQGVVQELKRLGVQSLAEIPEWLKATPKVKATRYEYRLDKVKRLKLPDSPGIYKMLGKQGEILYVGKATSLRSRVNSYFRGIKGRDQRKLEMMAQVWDLQVTPCLSPLEAALLESDEIKRFNPPYNVVLKTGRRHLVFYKKDFTESSRRPDSQFTIGPFRGHNWIEHLRLITASTQRNLFDPQIFFEPLPEPDLQEGFKILIQRHDLKPPFTVRHLLAKGLNLHRHYLEPSDEVQETQPQEEESSQPELKLSPEEIADKFERLLRRAGAEFRRSRKLTRLLDAQVQVGERTLNFRQGQLQALPSDPLQQESTAPGEAHPWQGLEIDSYDRMSILLSELDRQAGL